MDTPSPIRPPRRSTQRSHAGGKASRAKCQLVLRRTIAGALTYSCASGRRRRQPRSTRAGLTTCAFGCSKRAARNRKDGQTLSPRSVNMALGVLGQALDLAVDHGLLVANPARGSRRKSEGRQVNPHIS